MANTEIQLKYLACAHIDLKNELSVLHQMVSSRRPMFRGSAPFVVQIQRLLDESLLNKVDQQVANDSSMHAMSTSTSQMEMTHAELGNGYEANRIINKVNHVADARVLHPFSLFLLHLVHSTTVR